MVKCNSFEKEKENEVEKVGSLLSVERQEYKNLVTSAHLLEIGLL